MSEQEYESLNPGDYVIIRYAQGCFSQPRKLIGKSGMTDRGKTSGTIIWFRKLRDSWTSSPYAYYSKWNAMRWMSLVRP